MVPRLSICIPTYNRAALLDDCLERLNAQLRDVPSVEIVVSDNGSTDETADVIAAHCRRNPAISGHRLASNRGPWANRVNALHQARGALVAFLADDDSLLVENLLRHVEQMEREPDLVAIFTDWIAWDDQSEQELHRYFSTDASVTFSPSEPLALVDFVVLRNISPEIAVYRREALVRCQMPYSHAVPFHTWMYALSRLGPLRFDLLPFYREHRVLKAQFARSYWVNIDMQLHYIGDEMRLTLESLLLLALLDAGHPQVPDDLLANARQMIEQSLRSRVGLEIERACGRGDWILAIELRRRQVLWDGPGSLDDIRNDMHRLVVPAALQAINQTFQSLSGVAGVALRGFAGREIHDVFTRHYPETPLLGDADTDAAQEMLVHRDERTLAADDQALNARNVLVLERLLIFYRLTAAPIDLNGL